MLIQAAIDGLETEEVLTVSQWADQYRVLASSSTSEAGPWRTSRTPYLREPMDMLSAHMPGSDVVMMKGTQIGATEAGCNFIGYAIDHAPAPIMVVWPTSTAGKRNSKQRISPLISESPAIRQKIKPAKSRDGGNTMMMKEFRGGVLVIAGANSATELKTMPVQYLFCDEVDEYPPDVDNQGDPVSLANKRTSNFPRRKRLYASTPTVEDFSVIADLFDASDQRHYYMPCPHCGGEQYLQWAQFGWEVKEVQEHHCRACGVISENVESCPDCGAEGEVKARRTDEVTGVWYTCEHCQGPIKGHHKTRMLAEGKWVAHNPGPDRAYGYHIPAFLSPVGWYSWMDAVRDYLASEGNEEKRKVWHNTVEGLAYADRGEQPSYHEIAARAEDYAIGTIPLGGLLLVASVDVQKDRLESKVKAWGADEESWLVDVQRFYGDPMQLRVWADLAAYLEKPFPHESGKEMKIVTCFVDAGYMTQMVYRFCKDRTHVCPIKGVSGAHKPPLGRPTKQDIDYTKTTKIEMWPLGVDPIKTRIYARLKAEPGGPQTMHFPMGLPDEYFEQLTAERLINVPTKYGTKRQMFVKRRGLANEALDLEVYNYAAALYAGLTKIDFEKLAQSFTIQQQPKGRRVRGRM
jgi:phage terminase large subunit GpA-like protein